MHMLWLPPLQHAWLGQQLSFFWQHSGASDARLPKAEETAYGAAVTVASRANSASFFMMRPPLDL